MTTIKVCGTCGKPVAADAPQGLCPECLMKAGMGGGSGSKGGTGLPGFVPPTVEEMRKLFPQFEILELIGKGGMGAVYKARQPALDRLVALKILPPRTGTDPGFAERFTREARALARLSHPNIVAVHDFGQADGLHYLVMQYIDGPNLRELERAGKLSPREALQIIPQICEALQYAHDEGVVHRDIKPENVLLDKKGRIKIADFGLAKMLGAAPQDFRLTGERDIMGTPHYMAPEQMDRPQEVDHRADIYSLGVVFYEMLTGELPLGKFAPPSQKAQIDVRLDEVVLRALENAPERRYQHASEIKTDVETITTRAAQQPPRESVAEVDAIRQQVNWPALGLLVTGVLNWLVLPFVVALLVPAMARAGHVRGLNPPLALLLLSPFVFCSLTVFGALKMRRLEAYAAAIVASLLAMIVTPGNIIGLPIGIWSLVVLSRREVREQFQKHKVAAKVSGSAMKGGLRPLVVVGAVAVITGLLLLTWTQLRRASALSEAVEAARNQEIARQRDAKRPVETLYAFANADSTPISRDLVRDEGGWSVTCNSTQTFRLFEMPNPKTHSVLQRLLAERENLRTKYTEAHPKVRQNQAEIERAENAIHGHPEAELKQAELERQQADIAGQQADLKAQPGAGSASAKLSPGTLTYRARLKTEGLVGRAYLEMFCVFSGQGEAFSRAFDNVVTGSNDWATYQTPFYLKAGEEPDLIKLNLVVEGKGKVFIKDIELLLSPLPP